MARRSGPSGSPSLLTPGSRTTCKRPGITPAWSPSLPFRRRRAPTLSRCCLMWPGRPDRLGSAQVRIALQTVGQLVCDTAMLTNLGNVPDPPDFGHIDAVTMAFSAQAQLPRGLTVGVITAGGQLALTLRYNTALFDATAADKFAAGLLMALNQVSRSDDRPSPAQVRPVFNWFGKNRGKHRQT